MHRTLKADATIPPKHNILQQQETFDLFKQSFNFERPHQAIDMKYPGEIYKPSRNQYTGLKDIPYPGYDKALLITNCGRICIGRKLKVHVSKAFANQPTQWAARSNQNGLDALTTMLIVRSYAS